MKKTIVILIFCLIQCITASIDSDYLVFTPEQIDRIKSAIDSDDAEIRPYVNELQEMAEFVKDKGPWSVTFDKSKALSGDPHDYYSEGPYWWPDPDNPGGPYIRKDGLRNPDRFMAHKKGLQLMSQAVFILSMAGYFLENTEYTDRAIYLLKVWFTGEKTFMNPNLDYGQAIPNKSPGRGVGIIDTHRLAKMIPAFGFLDASGRWKSEDQNAIKNWFGRYLYWLLQSKNGRQERNQGNNHSTWWAVQVAAYASFSGNREVLNEIWSYSRNELLHRQLAENGSFPLELARTRSFDYSIFNLNAFTMLYRIAQHSGVDLWQAENEHQVSIESAMQYLYPYMENPDSWPGEQIILHTEREPFALIFAGEYYNEKRYIDWYKSLRKNRKIASDKSYDPFVLLINLYSCTI